MKTERTQTKRATPIVGKKLTPAQRVTIASYHEMAYRSGFNIAGQMLEVVVGLKNARTGFFDGIDRRRFQPDMVFIRGLLDAIGPLFGDAAPLMRSKFGVALQEAILDDFFDNAEVALKKLRAQPPERFPRF